jgi:hypothetical protein
MRNVELPWNACLITQADKPSDYRDLKNALVYASNIHWISLEGFVFWMNWISYVWDKVDRDRLDRDPSYKTELVGPFINDKCRKTHDRFQHELVVSGLSSHVTRYMTTEDFNNDVFIPLREQGRSIFQDNISSAIKDSRMVIDFRTERTRHGGRWNSYYAAGHLLQAVSRLLLPDLSSLPLAALAELREGLKDTLDPMRAEMLRFTEDLRNLVSNGAGDPELVSAEAENLIATRVEPVV